MEKTNECELWCLKWKNKYADGRRVLVVTPFARQSFGFQMNKNQYKNHYQPKSPLKLKVGIKIKHTRSLIIYSQITK